MGRKKKIKEKVLNKKQTLYRLVSVPDSGKTLFYMKEYTILNRLIEEFPGVEFWENVLFPHKLKSLAFIAGPMKPELARKYRDFNYVIPVQEQIVLGEKQGEDAIIDKVAKNVKQFLSI